MTGKPSGRLLGLSWRQTEMSPFRLLCFVPKRRSSLLAAYTQLVDGAIQSGDGANLFRIDPIQLTDSSSLLAIVIDRKRNAVVAGTHCVADGDAALWLQGVVTDAAYRQMGIGRAVFANAIVNSARHYQSADFRLVIRELNGHPSPAAFGMYQSFRFRVVERIGVRISGERCDAHLQQHAEGARKDHFYALRMSAGLEALRMAADHISGVKF